jgi:hypothetical protein
VILENCSEALHILDRFHIVAKMNKALDEIRAGESRRIASEGGVPVLKKSRWLLLKREENLKTEPPTQRASRPLATPNLMLSCRLMSHIVFRHPPPSRSIALREPADLTLPDHVHRLISRDRVQRTSHGSKPEARRDSLLDETMVLFQNIVHVR